MTESQLTRRELQRIKSQRPNAFLWKVNDRITAGIPDAVIVENGHTFWIEFKVLRPGERIEQVVREAQRLTMQRLARANHGDVIVVAFRDRKQELYYGDTLQRAPWATLSDYLDMDERLQ